MTAAMALPEHSNFGRARWALTLTGLGLFVAAVVALSGPGRIDIVDGQTRFEAGRSLVEQGDTAIRDPRVYFSRFPGRAGLDFTLYRFPQTAIAAAAIVISDATGPVSEARRHFLFTLHGAVACGLIAVLFAVHFRRRGMTPRAAVGWAAAGIFCSPCWYYGTSTFDDILGATCVVAALVSAARAGSDVGYLRVAAVGLLLGLAFNCKPPLAVFLLPALALADNRALSRPARIARAGLMTGGVALGVFGCWAYDRYKFPPEIKATHGPLLERYPPIYFGNPAEALLDFVAGPSSGSLWYFPPVILCLCGMLWLWRRGDRCLVLAGGLAAGIFVGFLSLMTFYKGDPAWGPRYLTPLFAAGWLVAPYGAAVVGRRWTKVLIALGVVVQVLGLAVEPQRLYVEQRAPSDFYMISPWLHFNRKLAHLPNRPREVYEAVTAAPAPAFTPAPTPTFAPPSVEMLLGPGEEGPQVVARYQIYSGLRFWWASLPHLPLAERPVAVGPTVAVLGAAAAFGFLLTACGLKGRRATPVAPNPDQRNRHGRRCPYG
jgi:hypothetical protein